MKKSIILVFVLISSSNIFADSISTWTARASMPFIGCGFAAGVVNNKIYVVGGSNRNGFFSTVEEYDPTINQWTIKSSTMYAEQGVLAAGVVNNKIFAIGGVYDHGIQSPTVEEYDPIADTWTIKASMLTARCALAVGVVNNKIYAIGGQGSLGNLATVEEYDAVADTWTLKASTMPFATDSFAAGVVNNKIYVIGGINNDGWPVNTVSEYDPATDQWTKKASMPTARSSLNVVVIKNKIFAIGGVDFTGYPVSTVEEYDPAIDHWITQTNMLKARYCFASAVVDDNIYAIGGEDSSFEAISNVEKGDTSISTLHMPTNFNGLAVSTISIQWSWTNNSPNEAYYAIKDQDYINISTGLPPNTTSWTENNLTGNILCTRYVVAYSSNGEVYSNIKKCYTIVNSPTGLSLVVVYLTSATIRWDNVNAKQYEIDRAPDNNGLPGTYSQRFMTGVSSYPHTSCTDFGLSTGTAYWYRAISSNGDDIFNPIPSNELKIMTLIDTTPPSAPAQVRDGTGTDIDAKIITVYVDGSSSNGDGGNGISIGGDLSANWDASSDPESGIVKYWYAISSITAGGTDFVDWKDNGISTSVIKSGLTLVSGNTYYFTVKAENGMGLQSNPTNSNGQFIVIISTGFMIPPPINQVRDGTGTDIAYTYSTKQLSANWDAAIDPENGISKYWYAIGSTSGGTNVVDWSSTTTTNVTKTGLSLNIGTTYYFTVKAENGIGGQSAATNSNGQVVIKNETILPYTMTDFSQTKISPNPLRNPGIIKFDKIPASTQLIICSLSGESIRVINNTINYNGGYILWDGKNEQGDNLATGIYIYVLKAPDGQKKTGKIAIIR